MSVEWTVGLVIEELGKGAVGGVIGFAGSAIVEHRVRRFRDGRRFRQVIGELCAVAELLIACENADDLRVIGERLEKVVARLWDCDGESWGTVVCSIDVLVTRILCEIDYVAHGNREEAESHWASMEGATQRLNNVLKNRA